MNEPKLGVALVTGASSGIGHATAKALRNAGFRVFGTSRRAAAERSDGAIMLSCDVTDDASVAKLVDEVLAEAGRIDVLVNNAGIGAPVGAEESSTAQAQALFDVNVFGVLRMTKAVLPTMRRQRKGRIINMSSIVGAKPDCLLAAYDPARAGMEAHMRNGVESGDAPEVVAETVVQAATAAVPRRRYAAGRLARQVRLMRRFVPEFAFDKSLRKHNHLPV